jgi:hypothetical protein
MAIGGRHAGAGTARLEPIDKDPARQMVSYVHEEAYGVARNVHMLALAAFVAVATQHSSIREDYERSLERYPEERGFFPFGVVL